nr:hypothetical protein [Tanacetum cinerariifolium]
TNVVGFDKLKVKCFNCHKIGHFARECRALRSQDRGRRDNYRQGSKVEEQALTVLMAIDEDKYAIRGSVKGITSSILPLYALTLNPTVYVSHIRQFWSTARVETSNEEIKILATVDDQNRATIAKSSTLPHDSAPRVTSPAADEGKDREAVATKQSGEDAPIKGRSNNEGEAAAERIMLRSHDGWKTKHFKGMSLEEIKAKFDLVWRRIQDFIPNGSKEEGERFKGKGIRLEQDSAMKVKTSDKVPEEKLKEMMQLILVEQVYVEALQVATVSVSLAGEIPTGSGSVPTASLIVPTASPIVPTGSGVVPTSSPIFTTATVATPYTRRKEEEMAKDAQRMNEQIARDAKIARIHAKEELQMMIDGLDRNNKVISKHLQEYYQAAAELTIGEKMELINELGRSLESGEEIGAKRTKRGTDDTDKMEGMPILRGRKSVPGMNRSEREMERG